MQKIDTRLDEDVDEFEEFDEFDDELDEPVDIDEITKELEKLPPEEFKQRFVQLIATMQAAAKAAEDTDDTDEKKSHEQASRPPGSSTRSLSRFEKA